MAVLDIAKVRLVSGTPQSGVAAAVGVASGDLVRLDTSTGEPLLNLADDTSEENARVLGVALTDAAAGEWPVWAGDGSVVEVEGAAMARGDTFVLSSVPGKYWKVEEFAAAGEFLTWVGYAASPTRLALYLLATGVARAAGALAGSFYEWDSGRIVWGTDRITWG